MNSKSVHTLRRYANPVKRASRVITAVAAFVSLFAVLPCIRADNTLNITYFTISSSDPDANHLSFGVVNNEVQNALGPNGLPVLNTPPFGCTSNCFSLPSGPTNLLPDGEITYWAPQFNSFVTQTGTGVVTLPFSVPVNFFPPNGTGPGDGGANGFQAAILSGALIVPSNTSETISFNIGADDMAFAYLDGQVVCDLGGVHGSTPGTCISSMINGGSHTIEVFFVDVNQIQSGLTFGINTSNVVTSSVPEPGSISLLTLGLVWLGFGKSHKAKSNVP